MKKLTEFYDNAGIKAGSFLVCPDCKGFLSSEKDSLRCEGCGHPWPIAGGVPCFLKDGAYWGEIPRKDMENVIVMAKEKGWRTSLETLVRNRYPKIYQSIRGEYRADFRFLLPINDQQDVLDIGAGWGQLSFLLSPFARSVWALENVSQRVEFMLIRKVQDRIRNLMPVWGSALSPPFLGESFDVAIMNGVLEWLGTWDEAKAPGRVQKDALRTIHSLLRPGGFLYIGIENRYGINNFLGARDHSGYRFTSLMPRWMANLYLRMRGHSYRSERDLRSYRTYTYSYSRYEELLEDVGFASVNIYAALPHYARPLVIVPLEDEKYMRFFIKNIFLPNSLLTLLGGKAMSHPAISRFARFVVPHFIIICKKHC